MEQPRRSRTVEIPAIMRALHQIIDHDPKILTDPVAPRLIGGDDDHRWLAPLLDHPFAKQWRAGFALVLDTQRTASRRESDVECSSS